MLMGWIIFLAILFLLAILPLGVSAKYDSDGVKVGLIAGPIRLTLLPGKKKEKADKPKEKKKKPEKAKPEKKEKTQKKSEEKKKPFKIKI